MQRAGQPLVGHPLRTLILVVPWRAGARMKMGALRPRRSVGRGSPAATGADAGAVDVLDTCGMFVKSVAYVNVQRGASRVSAWTFNDIADHTGFRGQARFFEAGGRPVRARINERAESENTPKRLRGDTEEASGDLRAKVAAA